MKANNNVDDLVRECIDNKTFSVDAEIIVLGYFINCPDKLGNILIKTPDNFFTDYNRQMLIHILKELYVQNPKYTYDDIKYKINYGSYYDGHKDILINLLIECNRNFENTRFMGLYRMISECRDELNHIANNHFSHCEYKTDYSQVYEHYLDACRCHNI